MAYNDGGIATFVDKGVYDAETTYYRLNYVKFNGSIFVCRKTSLGNTPNNTVDTEYWMKFLDAAGQNLYFYDNAGIVATQRDGIQFMNGFFEDDSQGNKTKITIGISNTDWAAIQAILGTGT